MREGAWLTSRAAAGLTAATDLNRRADLEGDPSGTYRLGQLYLMTGVPGGRRLLREGLGRVRLYVRAMNELAEALREVGEDRRAMAWLGLAAELGDDRRCLRCRSGSRLGSGGRTPLEHARSEHGTPTSRRSRGPVLRRRRTRLATIAARDGNCPQDCVLGAVSCWLIYSPPRALAMISSDTDFGVSP